MIETSNLKDWWDVVRQRYSPKDTILNESDEAFTILQVRGKQNILLARFCRTTGVGVVLERRQHQRECGLTRRVEDK